MKAKLKLDKQINEKSKSTIVRNLCRILDIRITNIDIRKNVLSFVYQNQGSFEQVRNELKRLGYPIREILQIKNDRKRLGQNV